MLQNLDIVNNWGLANVFNGLEQGTIKIPRFQRDFVWKRTRIAALLNSIYKQYPIGSFFIWETSAEHTSFCREIAELDFPAVNPYGNIQFIIDGQQRITSLYVALKGKQLGNVDYATICFNLDKKKFHIPKLKTEKNDIPAWKIFDQEQLAIIQMECLTNGTEKGREYWKTLQDCKHILDNYPISLIISRGVGLEDAITIFESINQGGKRLTLFELVNANVWSNDFDINKKIAEFNAIRAISNFGKLSSATFTQSLALNVFGNCTNLFQLKLRNDNCKQQWDITQKCLLKAVDFVKKSFGVQNISILPYENVLAIIQYFFLKLGTHSYTTEQEAMLKQWFWSLTFSKYYSSSTLTKMRLDVEWIDSIVEGGSEGRTFRISTDTNELKTIEMKTASVVKNGVLCILALNNPKDFNNGQVVTLDNTNASRSNSKENHHFFPYSKFKDFNITQKQVNSVLNFAFISKSLNLEILNDLPSDYIARYEANNSEQFPVWMDTHFIDAEALDCAKRNDYDGFIEARGKLIIKEIYRLCESSAQTNLLVADVAEEGNDTADNMEDENVID